MVGVLLAAALAARADDRAPIASGGADSRAPIASDDADDRTPITSGGADDRGPIASGGADHQTPIKSGGAVIVQPRLLGRLYGGIALIGGGVAAIGIASYVAFDARSDYDAAAALCPRHACTTRSAYDATQDARTRANLMTIVGGAGVAMVGAGVWLVLTSKSEPVKLEAVSVRPLVGRHVVGLAIGGSL